MYVTSNKVEINCYKCIIVKKCNESQAYACNSSYLGDGDWENCKV
jgi:hypothetical protein